METISFRKLLGTAFFCALALVLTFVYAVHIRFVERNALAQVRTHMAGQAEAITDLLQADLASGFYPAVVQRADRALKTQTNIIGLKVEMRGGYVVYDMTRPGTQRDVVVITKRVSLLHSPGEALDDDDWIAILTIQFSLKPHTALMEGQRRAIIAGGVIVAVAGLVLSALLSGLLAAPIRRLAREMTRGDMGRLQGLKAEGAAVYVDELAELYSQTHRLACDNLEFQDRLVAQERERATWEIARQVAHDIRSPLAALDVASDDVAQLPEHKRALIHAAVSRIHDIANSLLNRRHTQAAGDAAAISAIAVPQQLLSLIDQVVSEKRLQFQSRSRVRIATEYAPDAVALLANIQRIEFARVLSNLINNAVEALGDEGLVAVGLASGDGHARVSVQDDGKGIPSDVLVRLGRRGETYGKPEGTGLGLFHARTSVESWGGSLELASVVGKGTTLTLLLPLAVPGAVLLDDDELVHATWRVAAEKAGVALIGFRTPEELMGALERISKETSIYLDSDLGGATRGESLAIELGARGYKNIYLATGRSKDDFTKLDGVLGVVGKAPPWG